MKTARLRVPRNRSGFTFVEVLIAAVIGAAVLAAVVVAYGTITRLPGRLERLDVTLPGGVHDGFYGAGAGYVTIAPAPNYWEAVKAREMKDRLEDDINKASAVFCLGRNGHMAGVRPNVLNVTDDEDFRDVATPDAFLTFLGVGEPGLASSFVASPGGVLSAPNMTIFVLKQLASQMGNAMEVQATYEIDFVAASSPSGTFASVRRYDGGAAPTHYYHVFYPGDSNTGNPFRPLAIFFGRADRPTPGPFDLAPNYPFTFVWWPDPLVSFLSDRATGAAAILPRSGYANMGGRTSLFFVLPTFPPL
jgi:prepilin-type N-terminal cleavage/methylation domain-containing protein